MTHAFSAAEDQARQIARLRRFLRWLFILGPLLGFPELLGGIVLQVPPLALVGSLTLGTLGFVLWARILLERGLLRPAVLVLCSSILLVIIGMAVAVPQALPALVLSVILVVTLALPYLDRRSLGRLILSAAATGMLITFATRLPFIQQLFPPLAPLLADGLVIVTVAVCLGLVLLLMWQFSTRLNETLAQTQATNAALQVAQTGLEAEVAARTAELQAALAEVRERAEAQARLLAEVERQRTTIHELSVPVIPVSATTLIMPLIGALDTERLRVLQEQALRAIERTGAQILILDITGVPLIDSQAAQGLMIVVQTTKLLGAAAVLVGVRPEVAQAIVGLGLSLQGMRTFNDLQSALGQLDGRSAVSTNGVAPRRRR